MIEVSTKPDFAGLTNQLTQKARALATARAANAKLEARKDPARWRSAKLLWPLFAKD